MPKFTNISTNAAGFSPRMDMNSYSETPRTSVRGHFLVEITRFVLKPETDESKFVEAAERMQIKFLIKQKGFMRRHVARNDEEWVDVVHWNSREDADQAMKGTVTDTDCLAFFQMIDTKAMKISYYEQKRSW